MKRNGSESSNNAALGKGMLQEETPDKPNHQPKRKQNTQKKKAEELHTELKG